MSDNQFVDLSAVMNRNSPYRSSVDKNGDVWPSLDNPYVPHQEKVESFAQEGYPVDDAVSLQQMAGDCANLDIFYAQNFYQNESHDHQGGAAVCSYTLEHTPILPGTTTGTIIRQVNDGILDGTWVNVQTFVLSANGNVQFQDIGEPLIKGLFGTLNLATGVLTLTYNEDPGVHRIIVSYEADAEVAVPQNEPVWSSQGKWTPYKKKEQTDNNTTSYIDYLVNQLSEARGKLYDAEEKLAAIHQANGGQKTIAELEVEMHNEYDKKLKQMKEYFVDKIDQFLKVKMGTEEEAKKIATRPAVDIFEEAIDYEVATCAKIQDGLINPIQ